MSESGIPEKYKVDHLILLVGGNPLPNAVAGRLLLRDGGRITLVHSAETCQMAENLQHWLANYTILSEAQEVPASQAAAIYAAVTNLLLDDKEIVGLNYSGGTKTMAVHAQLALRDKLGLAALPHLSYLDSRALRMRFDDGTSVKVGQSLQVDLETDLMQLHKGLQLDLNNPPTRFAILPRTARAVAMMWADKAEREAWQAWLHGELGRYQLRRSTFNKERQRWQNWASEAQLRQVQISFPPVVGELMREELVLCGYPAENSHLDLGLSYDCLYRRDVHSSVEDLCAWFWSKWLEHYVFVCLDGLRSEFGFHSILMGVETSPMRFEVDVVALRGYQLCAFSCSTTYRHDTLKLKLFEAVVRARQLGGDEVRIALVCTNFRPTRLQEEFKNTIDRRIKVFGLYELATLQSEIADWIAPH